MQLRRATEEDLDVCWRLVEAAAALRREQGSEQWQNGYPNRDIVRDDILRQQGYVCENEDRQVVGYMAIVLNGDRAYDDIRDGEWLTGDANRHDYVVVHRLAVSRETNATPDGIGPRVLGLGTLMMAMVETDVLPSLLTRYKSIRVDTNYDNPAMLRILAKLNYTRCGTVIFRGNCERIAFEKVVIPS